MRLGNLVDTTRKDPLTLDLQRRSGGVDGTSFLFALPPSHTRIFRLRRLQRRTRPQLMSMDPSAAGSLPSPCASLPPQRHGYFTRDYEFPARGSGSGCPRCRDPFSRMVIFEHVFGWSLAGRLQYCGMHAAECHEVTDHICDIAPCNYTTNHEASV